jgi:hypothetical protein
MDVILDCMPPSLEHPAISSLANTLALGALLDELRTRYGAFDLIAHFTQGEFHHDVVLRVPSDTDLPGPILVVATNCNGGVKEVLCVSEEPDSNTLWAMRCPGNPEFGHVAAKPVARSETVHWFDPCELLLPDARSELRPEYRVRQEGGGWVQATACSKRRES